MSKYTEYKWTEMFKPSMETIYAFSSNKINFSRKIYAIFFG